MRRASSKLSCHWWRNRRTPGSPECLLPAFLYIENREAAQHSRCRTGKPCSCGCQDLIFFLCSLQSWGVPYILTDKPISLTPIHGALAQRGDHAFVLSPPRWVCILTPLPMATVSAKVSLRQLMAGRAPLRSRFGKRPGIVIQSDQPVAVLLRTHPLSPAYCREWSFLTS